MLKIFSFYVESTPNFSQRVFIADRRTNTLENLKAESSVFLVQNLFKCFG